MLHTFFLVISGLCFGIIVAAGAAGLAIGLSIIPRYAGITRTARYILLYEDMTVLGIFLGNLFYLFEIQLPLGNPFLLITGLFFGIFLGSWILALAEMLSVLPVFSKRLQLNRGLSCLVISIALGKTLGCFLFYFFKWY